MNPFDDSSDEMYNNDLSSSDAEGLVRGDIDSPVHAELIGLMSEVRNLSAGTPTPTPGAALSEFVGVGLTTNNIPVETPEAGIDLRLAPTAAEPVTTRRNSVFAQIAAFAGTVGGKVVLSSAVAAASISGAHATGVVDVPYLPDTAAEIETVDTQLGDESIEVADIPEALTFAERQELEELENPWAVTAGEEESEEADKAAENDAESDADKDVEKVDLHGDIDKKIDDEKAEAEKAEERAIEEAEKAEAEKAEIEAKEAAAAEEKAKQEAEAKAELDAKKEAEEEAKDKTSKTDHDVETTIAQLEEQLERDKAAVIAAAREDIVYYETKRENKEASLEADLKGIDEQFSGYVADIDAQIDASTDEQEIEELKAYREQKLVWWEEARADRELAYQPYLADIDKELEKIEIARDAKIELLIADFLAAVEKAKS